MKTNNKLLLFLIIFIAILLFLTLDCFAVDMLPESFTSLTAEEKLSFLKSQDIYDENDNNLKYVFFCYSDYNAYLLLSDYPFKVSSLGSGTSGSIISGIGTVVSYCFYSWGGEVLPSPQYDFDNNYDTSGRVIGNFNTYSFVFSNKLGTSTMLETLSINHDLTYVDSNDIAISREDCNDPFPPITLTLEEVLEKGYQTASETTRQSMTAQIVETLPVGIAILATMIVVSLIAYFKLFKA